VAGAVHDRGGAHAGRLHRQVSARAPDFSIRPGQQGLPVTFGPVTGTGTRAFTITVSPAMAFDLECAGKGLAWARSAAGVFAVACSDPPGSN
jgi:hypothetical protein